MPIDAGELAKLIEAQAAVLRLWVRSRCASADDVVQEAFCRLAAAEQAPENPVAWLYRVCRNLAQKQRRSDIRRVARERVWAELQNEATSDVDPLEIAETLAAVESLDDDLREVLVARVWGQLSLEEVAQLCGVSTATAFRRYHAALQALRLKLAPKSKKRS